ncbi:MAG: hypothetical protein JSV49_00695, partial [Thermoplasmata archaeon]
MIFRLKISPIIIVLLMVIISLVEIVNQQNNISISENEPKEGENDIFQENLGIGNEKPPDNSLINKEMNTDESDSNIKNKPMKTRAIGKETQITTDPATQRFPDIYGDRIVWIDDRNGAYDIYMYDLSTSTETRRTTDTTGLGCPAIYGDRIVWSDNRNGNSDIYMYNLSTNTEKQITTNSSNQQEPDIYGDRIVWSDNRNGWCDIYMYDLSNSTETRITTNSSHQWRPIIYGNRILWLNGFKDIYMYDLNTSNETVIANTAVHQPGKDINGDRIVWENENNGILEIYMYEIGTGTKTQITKHWANQRCPSIYGNRIVWIDDRNGDYDIYSYDLGTRMETRITTEPTALLDWISIYGNRIVWGDKRSHPNFDIYMYEFLPSAPNPLGLNVSKPFVYRPDVIELYSNAYDHEDLENNLLPHFEYLSPSQTNWQTNLLSQPEYTNGRWQTVFSIPVNATLGFYDFRVRYKDTDYMWSPWCYLNGSFRVLNNPPEMDYFDISKTSVEIGESFILFVNGT